MEWIDRLHHAVAYIEGHLTEEIDYSRAAKEACCSLYHFQRMFAYMAGTPLSEYIQMCIRDSCKTCIAAGANVLVAGSAVYKADDIPARIAELRG